MAEDIFSRPTTAVGVFRNREDLERALEQLMAAGFREEQTSVAMRGIRQSEVQGPSQYDEVQEAALSILNVRANGRHEEVEAILRNCGAAEINWTNSLTTGVAGSSEEIVDSES